MKMKYSSSYAKTLSQCYSHQAILFQDLTKKILTIVKMTKLSPK